jgi:multimeric flavodoxin WrbA
MKILGICCSPRQGQATYKAMQVCLDAVNETSRDIKTELIELAGLDNQPCLACDECKKGLSQFCSARQLLVSRFIKSPRATVHKIAPHFTCASADRSAYL